MNQLMVQLLAIYYLTVEFLICFPQKQEKNISCCNFFAFTSVLGDFCKHWDTTTVTQLSGGQATTGSSLALGPSFQMETATAPGISYDSIMHCQDWVRLLCQSNVVDPHQPTLHLFYQFSVCVRVSVWVLEFYFSTACPLWNNSFPIQYCLSFLGWTASPH